MHLNGGPAWTELCKPWLADIFNFMPPRDALALDSKIKNLDGALVGQIDKTNADAER